MKRIIAGAALIAMATTALVGCGGSNKPETQSDKCKAALTSALNQFMDTKTASDVFGLALMYGASDDSNSDDLGTSIPACKPLSKTQQQDVEKQLKPLANKVQKHVEKIVPLEGN